MKIQWAQYVSSLPHAGELDPGHSKAIRHVQPWDGNTSIVFLGYVNVNLDYTTLEDLAER